MATIIIATSREAITVHNNRSDQCWRFSVKVERYTYKTQYPRYNTELVVERFFPEEEIKELLIHRFNRGDIRQVDEAYQILQSLLKAINDGDSVWDINNHL